jgi:hypothetical protein
VSEAVATAIVLAVAHGTNAIVEVVGHNDKDAIKAENILRIESEQAIGQEFKGTYGETRWTVWCYSPKFS